MTSEGFSCHGTYNTDGQPGWASRLREHVTEGAHIATVSGVKDPDLLAPRHPRYLSPTLTDRLTELTYLV